MYAKIFSQIFASSIVENPELRFTFIDFLILADPDGVVDMTHESIARVTNRPLDVIRRTITELEGPDIKSRTPDASGARIVRLDDHRDWGWMIVNYAKFRNIASDEQRRKKTRDRVARFKLKHKEKPSGNASVTHGNASVTPDNADNAKQKQKQKQKDILIEVPSVRSKPSLEEVHLYCAKSGISRVDAEWFWNHMEGNGWKNNGKPVVSWQRTLSAWKLASYLPSLRPTRNGQPSPAKQMTVAERAAERMAKELGL